MSLSSFKVTELYGCIVSHCSRQPSNVIVCVSISLASFGLIYVKTLIKFSAICVSSVIAI